MSTGSKSVGHPVDVATGVMHETFEDVRVPGRANLEWTRFYSTALAGTPGAMGPGWTNRYFCSLAFTEGAYRFTGPDGATVAIADPRRQVVAGGVARNLGAFTELRLEEPHFVVCRWNVVSGAVRYYVFPYERVNGAVRFLPLKEIRDATGQGVELRHDGEGRLVGVRQVLERRALLLERDRHDRIERVVFRAADGRDERTLARYGYDERGRLVSTTDARGFTDRFNYDDGNRIVREATRSGAVFEFAYDPTGRCVQTSAQDRYDEKILHYIDAAGWIEVTDSLGNVRRYRKNGDGQILSEVDPLGGVTESAFDKYGRLACTTGPLGDTTTYDYDEAGNCCRITNAEGGVREFEFEPRHRVAAYTDPNGSLWRYRFDEAHRMAASIDPDGSTTRYGYDAAGGLVEVVDPLGRSLRRELDARGVLVAIVDRSGARSAFRHDGFGRLIEYTDQLGQLSRYHYDPMGNLTGIELPDGTRDAFDYDAAASVTRHVDRDGGVRKFAYGPCGRLTETTNAVGAIIRFHWGSEPGRLEAVSNARGEIHDFAYDANGRLVGETGFDSRTTRYELDASGARIAMINALDQRIGFERDALGRLVELVTEDGADASFAYCPAGYLIHASNSSGVSTFTRDGSGRVTTEIQGECTLERRFDALGNRRELRSSHGHAVELDFDACERFTVCRLDAHPALELARDARGSETSRRLGEIFALHSGHDEMGRLLSQSTAPAASSGGRSPTSVSGEHVERRYAYEGSRIAEVDDSYWGRTTHVYDPADRVLESLREHGGSERFRYDETGNLTSVDDDTGHQRLIYEAGDRLASAGDSAFDIDAQGRVVRRTDRSPENADPAVGDAVWEFEWDSLDQLRAVKTPDGRIWRYAYDAFGRRVEKLSPDGERYGFVWNESVVLHELLEGVPTSTWVFDPLSFRPLLKDEDGKLLHVVTDHLGTPREMIDDTGAIVWRATHQTWGETRIERGDPERCPIRFPGQWHDAESGLHYNRFRYHDPRTGRYLSADPTKLMGGINPYRYTRNPIGWIDPFGLICENDTNNGEGYVVYHITDSDGNVVYVGMTQADRFRARRDEHVASGRLDPTQDRFMSPVVWAQTYGEIRGIEQAHITHAGPPGANGQVTSTRNTALRGDNSYADLSADPANRINSVSDERINNRTSATPREQAFQQGHDNEIRNNDW